EGQPTAELRTASALLIGHTCSIRGGPSYAKVQTVCEVRTATEREQEKFHAPWDGWWMLFPLVEFRDGPLWVADFSLISTVHVKHLVQKRIACLNEPGWAALQKRYANHCLRDSQPLELRQADLHRTWVEL